MYESLSGDGHVGLVVDKTKSTDHLPAATTLWFLVVFVASGVSIAQMPVTKGKAGHVTFE